MILSTRKASTALVDVIWAVADRQGEPRRKPAWRLAQKRWIVPIPGTTKLHRQHQNLGTIDLALAASDLDEINAQAGRIAVQGEHAARPRPYLPLI
jgi:aryl-alcohol dehydrogenase-like predicted oxidoreductase